MSGTQSIGLKELCEDLYEVAPKWQTFGIYLKVPYSRIQGFGGGEGMVERCFTSMLAAWLDGEGTCSIDQLVSALQMPGVDQVRLAMEINQNRNGVLLELPYLCEKLSGCKSSWFFLGLGLGIKPDKLKKFESERSSNSVEKCLSDLLMCWLKSGNATVEVLVDALDKVGLRVLADKIKRKYAGKRLALTSTSNSATDSEETDDGTGTTDQRGTSQPASNSSSSTTDTVTRQESSNIPHGQTEGHTDSELDDELHKQLKMGNLFDITQYLKNLSNEQLIDLGGALGLHFPNLRRMDDLPNEMVAAWLLRQDDVLKRSSEPTYERLAIALEEIGQNGLAKDVREQKHAKL